MSWLILWWITRFYLYLSTVSIFAPLVLSLPTYFIASFSSVFHIHTDDPGAPLAAQMVKNLPAMQETRVLSLS